jgi:hypothetical protein
MIRGKLRECAEVEVEQCEAAFKFDAQRFGPGLRSRVAVERKDIHLGRRGEQRAGVAAAAKGAIKITATRPRREEFEHLVQQDRPVAG